VVLCRAVLALSWRRACVLTANKSGLPVWHFGGKDWVS
jgi:hypothetical protein